MLLRSIGSTLILSSAIASAIALAQSPDKPSSESSDAQPFADVLAQNRAAESTPPVAAAKADGRVAPAGSDVLASPSGVVPAARVASPYGNTVGPATPWHPTYATLPVQPVSPEELQRAKEFRDAVEQLRRSDTPEKKEAARGRLNEIVAAQLERDFKEREQKLAEIEARAKALRDQLEQRRSSKDEIQKMLMLMIENPETGLGLPPTWISSLVQQTPGPVYVPLTASPSYTPYQTTYPQPAYSQPAYRQTTEPLPALPPQPPQSDLGR